MNKLRLKPKFTYNVALSLILVLLFLTIGMLNPTFFKMSYLVEVTLKNIVGLGLMALTMSMVIITGGIDLSNGSTMVLSTMLTGLLSLSVGGPVAFIVGLVFAGVLGFINGYLIAQIKLAPMIVTLSTMYLYRGIARGMVQGDSVYSFNVADFLGNSYILGIPTQIIVYVVVAILIYLLMTKTPLGRKVYAVGLNENATSYAGINTVKVKIAVYILTALIAYLAGLIYLGKFTTMKYIAGNASSMQTIAIVVLGGIDINGGSGDLKGVMWATLIMAVLNSGLTVLGVSTDIQTIFHGLILIVSLIAFFFIKKHNLTKKMK